MTITVDFTKAKNVGIFAVADCAKGIVYDYLSTSECSGLTIERIKNVFEAKAVPGKSPAQIKIEARQELGCPSSVELETSQEETISYDNRLALT